MKKEIGISLINICIIVAIIIIVATICACIFFESNKKSELNKYVSQMELIQEKVNWVRSEYKIWDDYNPNEAGNFYTYLQTLGYSNANSSTNLYIDEFNSIIKILSENNLDNWNVNADSIITNYCYFSPEDLNKYFSLENIDLHIIINFYTGNVISKENVEDDGKIIYRQYDCSFGNELVVAPIYNSTSIPKLEIIENYGLSQRVKISLDSNQNADIMDIYYYSSKNDENKKVCSNLKNYTYVKEENTVYFNIEISGDYTFIVEDTNFVQYPKIEYQFNLCNSPVMLEGMNGIYWDENGVEKRVASEYDSNWYNYSKNDFRMANAKTEDGNYWVWIPRYIYKETTEGIDIEFVIENSSIATNNKSMNGYKLQKAFSNENANSEIEGFWMAKFQCNIEDEKINIKPGKTLSLLQFQNIGNKYRNLLNTELDQYCYIMSEGEKEAALIISNAIEIDISTDLIHYAGGSPEENNFKENVKYSSTNNVYGIYDLYTSENEMTRDSDVNSEGRFRLTIVKK